MAKHIIKHKSNNLQQKYNMKSKESKNGNNHRRKSHYEEASQNFYLIPLFIILCIIPFIVRVKVYNTNLSQFQWFSEEDAFTDFFLYYRHWFFVSVISIMAIIVACKTYFNRKNIKIPPIFIPLAIFGFIAVLSAVFSKYKFFSFSGSFEMFESIFAILGYCIVVYYTYLIIQDENDVKRIMKYILVAAMIMSILGLFQFAGKDLFTSKLFYKLIVPVQYQNGNALQFNFEHNRVYLALYNPNYVGVYVSLVTPIILIMLFFNKNWKSIIISILSIIGLLIATVGSQSQAGIIGLGIVSLFIIVFMWRYLLKKYYITISVVVLMVIGLIVLNVVTDQLLLNRLKNIFNYAKAEYALTSMNTDDNSVSLTYNDNKLYVRYISTENQKYFYLSDDKEEVVENLYDASKDSYIPVDERYAGLSFGASPYEGVFYIQESGYQWLFTNQSEDGTYYHINRYGRLDKMITAPSAVFTGYEWFATARGYIWSRTIPLLKNYIFLGSGPDTFTFVYPQQDYLNFQRYGYGNGIITKPHNMYLQIAVQDGLIALLALLVFYGMYFMSSIRLYIKGRFNSYYSQVGVAIFVGTIGYMVTGLTNDSSITTAPIFWTLIGVGIAVNYKAKPLIQEEVAILKAAKANKHNADSKA